MSFFGIPIRNGLSLGLGAVASLTNGPPFLPSELFYNGTVQGAWYDPSDVAIGWRYNLLTYTEQFDNAVWTKEGGSILSNSASAPDGTSSADTFIESLGGAIHRLYQSFSVIAGTTYTWSVYAKPAGRQELWVSAHTGSEFNTSFDLLNGTVGINPSGNTAAITPVGNGWYRCSVTRTATATTTGYAIFYLGDGGGDISYSGDGTSGLFLWGAQLQTGSTATTYQQIVTPEISYLNYDPDPVLFQDAAGTTPVTAVEQAVGLMLDKSKGLVLGSELVTNGDFSSGSTGWTVGAGWTISGGQASVIGTTILSQAITGAPRTIRVQFDIVAISGSIAANYNQTNGLHNSQGPIYNTTGTKVAYININSSATSGSMQIFFQTFSAGQTATIDNISVRELPGNHAYQTTSASRPTLRARYNLVTRTEEFNDAVWGLAGGANAPTKGTVNTDKPDGTTGTVNTIIYPAVAGGGGNHSFVFQSTGATYLNVPLTYTVWMRVASGTGTIYLQVEDNSVAPSGGNFFTGPALTLTTTWQRFTLSGTRTSAAGNTSIAIGFDTRAAAGQTNAGPLTVQVWGAQLVPTAVFPSNTYQRVGAATDYATGAAFPVYLAADGIDDGLLTNSVDFSAGNKMTVWAGVTKQSETAAILCELSANVNTNTGSFYVVTGADPAPSNRYSSSSRGTAAVAANQTATTDIGNAPDTAVLTATHDIAASLSTIRRNTVAGTNGTGSKGTGNFGNYPLFIGRRNNATIPFNGNLYSLIIAGQSYSASQISSTESWVAAKTPLGTI